MAQTVLIIDDDQKLAGLLTDFLARFAITALAAPTPAIGLKLLFHHKPDLVVLDVMLPEMDGFQTLTAIRRQSRVPVIMLTARGDVTDRIVGLEMGADDYLAKPFEPRELVARIQSVLRRGEAAPGRTRYVAGALEVDADARRAALGGRPLDLSTSEFDALLLFVANPGKALSRDQIMDRLRGTDWAAFNRSVDVLVSRLRQKLGDDPKQPTYLKTIWGTGYMFIGGGSP